jgi:hypothetical protein
MDNLNDHEIQQSRIEHLLKEYDVHRDAIKSMIVDLEKIRTKVDTLIPDHLDARFMRYFEEKVKSVTALFNSLLDMRKEIAKSIKDEIEIRRRITDKSKFIDLEEMLDIRSMVEKVDEFKEKSEKIIAIRRKELDKKNVDETIIIPGLSKEEAE